MTTKPALAVTVVANLDEFRAQLKAGESVIQTTAGQLKSMGNAFDGSKIIGQAGAMMQAVENAGGATTLTRKEQERLNATLTEAINKYNSLGKEAPPQMVALRDQTAHVESAWDKANKALGAFGLSLGALSVAGVVGGLLSGAKAAIEFGSHLTDLRDQTGLTLDELQRLNYAGATVGLSIDQIAGAVNKLQKNLGAEGAGTLGALKQLNLHVDALEKMSPGDMFFTMAESIAKVEDPTQRAQIAMAALGKSGAELLPLLLAKVKELGDEAPKMSDRTIENLDRFDDAWAKSKIWVTSAIGGMIGAMTDEVSSVQSFAEKNTGVLGVYFGSARRGMEEVSQAITTMGGKLDEAAGTRLPGLIPPLGAASDALADFDKANKENEDQIKKNIAAYESHQKAVSDLADAYTGKKLAAEVRTTSEAFEASKKEGGLLASQLVDLSRKLDDLRSKGAVLPANLNTIADAFKRNAQTIGRDLRPVVVDYVSEVDAMNIAHYQAQQQFDGLIVKGKDLAAFFQNSLGPVIRDLPAPPVDKWREFREGASAEIALFASYVQSEGGLAGLVSYARDFARDFAAGFADVFLPGMGQVIAAAWPLIETGLKKLASAIGSFFKWVWGGLKSIWGALGTGIGQDFPEAPTYDPNTGGNPGNGDPNDPNGNQTQFANGGMVPATPGGRRVTVAEAGENEWLFPESRLRSLIRSVSGGGGDGGVSGGGGIVEVHLDGRRLASVVVPHLPGEIKKFRLA